MASRPNTTLYFRANKSVVIDDCLTVPNSVLAHALSDAVVFERARRAAYDWSPDQLICYVYCKVLLFIFGHALRAHFPSEHFDIFCSAAACAHSECTLAQYGRGLLHLFSMVDPYVTAMGETANFLPLFLEFAMVYVAERYEERTATGDSIRKDC